MANVRKPCLVGVYVMCGMRCPPALRGDEVAKRTQRGKGSSIGGEAERVAIRRMTPTTLPRERPQLALIASSLRCSDSVRLRCYLHHPGEPFGRRAHDPERNRERRRGSANGVRRYETRARPCTGKCRAKGPRTRHRCRRCSARLCRAGRWCTSVRRAWPRRCRAQSRPAHRCPRVFLRTRTVVGACYRFVRPRDHSRNSLYSRSCSAGSRGAALAACSRASEASMPGGGASDLASAVWRSSHCWAAGKRCQPRTVAATLTLRHVGCRVGCLSLSKFEKKACTNFSIFL